MPPDRNAPSGTSATIRRRTARADRLADLLVQLRRRLARGACASSPGASSARSATAAVAVDERAAPAAACAPPRRRSAAPARTRMPGRRRARRWSISRGTSGSCISARSSEAKLSAPRALAVEQRLLADAVAGQQQLAPAAVPQREREHAVQLAHAVRSRAPRRGGRSPRCRPRSRSVAAGAQAARAARGSCRSRRSAPPSTERSSL